MKQVNKLRASAEKGFSVVEMMVAMVIFLVVIGTVYGLLQIGLIDRNRAGRRSDVLKNARAAIHLISRDALNAGLSYNKSGAIAPDNFISARLGTPADSNTTRDALTAVIGGNNLFFDILNPNTSARTDTIAFAYRDNDFNGGNLIQVSSWAAAPGSPATVRLTTPAGAASVARLYDLYIVETDSSQVAVMATGIPSASTIDIAPGDPLGLNQPFNVTGSNGSLLQKCTASIIDNCSSSVQAVKRFFWVAYKIKSDGTLVRISFGNNTGGAATEQMQEMPIAYNVQDLQLQYVLEDGTSTDMPSDFNLVRQITVNITVQATENDEQLGKPEDITLSGTFSTRNLDYDAG